jgi:hypothetical protein
VTSYSFSPRRESGVELLRDGAEDVARALWKRPSKRSRRTAPPGERAGLETALRTAREAASASDAEFCGRGTRRLLAEAAYDGPPDSVAAIKEIRRTRPGLTLQQAVHLARPRRGPRDGG